MAMKKAGVRPLCVDRQKQLLFDRRYGWVYEEWTDPIEVANIGGRGMFSLVPLTASTLDGTLHLANRAADLMVHTVQNREEITLELHNKARALRNRTSQELRKLIRKVSSVDLKSICDAPGRVFKESPLQMLPILRPPSPRTTNATNLESGDVKDD